MNKQIILTLAMSAILLTANAQEQNRGPRRGQGMKSERQELTAEQRAERAADRIAGELMLDDASSNKFQSIYKDYQLELGEVNKKYMPERGKKDEGEKGEKQKGVKGEKKHRTDKEIDDGIKNRFAHQRALLDVEEKYYGKFRSVLNARQLEKVYRMSGKGRKAFGGKGKGGRGGFGRGPQRGGHGFGFRGQGGHSFGGGQGFGPHRGMQNPSGQESQPNGEANK